MQAMPNPQNTELAARDNFVAPTVRRNGASRYPFPGTAWFKVPIRFFDGGYASRLTPSQIARYFTLIRIANFEYGKEIVQISARELAILDGIAPRTARGVYTKLRELGLLRKSAENPHAILLVHPWQWPALDGEKPLLKRNESGKLNLYNEFLRSALIASQTVGECNPVQLSGFLKPIRVPCLSDSLLPSHFRRKVTSRQINENHTYTGEVKVLQVTQWKENAGELVARNAAYTAKLQQDLPSF